MTVNGIDIDIERKPIKSIHLSVYPPEGRVHVSSPMEYGDERIRLYAMQKMAWIKEKRASLSSYVRQSPREFVSGEAHYYKGDLYRLKIIRDNKVLQHVEINGDYLIVYARQTAEQHHIENIINEWYRSELRPIVADFIDKWSIILGVHPTTWEIQQLTTEWGSCQHAKGTMLINLQLAKKPLRCIEYVVAHEMAHLIERTHTDKFRAILDSHLPNWSEIQKELNEFPL